MATVYNSDSATLTGVSAEILAARPRRTFLVISNLSGADYAYFSLMNAAVAGTGIGLAPGQSMTMEVDEAFNESLYGISAGPNVDISIEERYEDSI